MARPRTLLWAHAFSGHSEVPRSKCCSDNMVKGPENSVFLGVDFLGKPYTSTNRGVGWAGGPRWVSKTNQVIGLSALNIDMGVMPEASRSLNCAERGIMKYSYLSYIYIYTVIIWFIKMIYRYIYMLDCPHVHTLKRVNCFAMFDIIQRHSVELAGRPRETFAPQMSLDTVLYYPGWRNMAQLQDITRHQPEKNEDTHTHTGIRVRKIRQFRSILCSI